MPLRTERPSVHVSNDLRLLDHIIEDSGSDSLYLERSTDVLVDPVLGGHDWYYLLHHRTCLVPDDLRILET